MNDSWKIRHAAYIKGGQQLIGVHELIDEYIRNNEGVQFDMSKGVSYINGRLYFNELVFETEADLLAFKLRFSENVI